MRALRAFRPILVCTVAASLVFHSASAGQDGRPQADPADVASVDAIVHALYDVISGPAGERDWERWESLFMTGARLIPTGVDRNGQRTSRVITPVEYSRNNGPFFLENPFFEIDDGERFWIATIMWDSEREGSVIPAKYLDGKR